MESVLKVRDPAFEIVDPPSMVIVLVGANVPLLPTERVPFTPKLEEDATVALAAMLTLLKFRVPPETTIEAPSFSVTVPPGLLKVPETVKAPPTVGEEDPVTAPLMISLE